MYYELLKQWCDELIKLQVTEIKRKEIYGGIMCPSCARIHGRCGDAIYPLMYMADRTGDSKYLESAKLLFNWSENMTRPDGSYINDTNSEWKGITVFSTIQLGEALYYHGHLLDEDTRKTWTKRFQTGIDFLYHFIDKTSANINYPITCAASMAIAGRLLNESRYLEKAKELAHRALEFIADDGLIFGEGRPHGYITQKGCRPVDLGYNVEESLPGLVTYGIITNDEVVLSAAEKAMEAHMEFMLPDGAWDNSWGTRSNKWTYWGSRTSDGCQIGYGLLAKRNPIFEEVVYRNTKLLQACTHDGLLYGGPMYVSAGEPPCVHHTFCHAKAIAILLEHNIEPKGGRKLPRELAQGIKFFPSIHVALLAKGKWRATVSDYDFEYVQEGNATGGAITMLWHEAVGPMIAGTMTRYYLVEPNNMQIPQYTENICLTPRIEYEKDGIYYRSINDKNAVVSYTDGEAINVDVSGNLVDGKQNGNIKFRANYLLSTEEVQIKVQTGTDDAVYYLPIISKNTDPIKFINEKHAKIITDSAVIDIQSNLPLCINGDKPNRIFNPVGGFEAIPFYVTMEKNKDAVFSIRVEK